MGVFTQLTEEDISAFLLNYPLGDLVSAKGIAEGVSNTNYFIETLLNGNHTRYILTVFESKVNPTELPFFTDLTLWLADRGVPCPKPVRGKGGFVNMIKGKPAAIVSFMEGQNNPEIRVTHLEQVGNWLGKMHTTAQNFPFYRHNALALDGLQKLFASVKGRIDEIETGLSVEIDEEITYLRRHWPYGLPSGIIHGDMFPDNVFFTGSDTPRPKLSGVIDFYYACSDFWIYDLLICMNAWCFDATNRFLPTRAKMLFEGYNKVRPITMPERNAILVLARAACVRFLLTRCYDWFNPVEGALVARKDPKEYLAKLRFHREVRGFWNYGI